MSRNTLKLNDDKTECIVFGTPSALKEAETSFVQAGKSLYQFIYKCKCHWCFLLHHTAPVWLDPTHVCNLASPSDLKTNWATYVKTISQPLSCICSIQVWHEQWITPVTCISTLLLNTKLQLMQKLQQIVTEKWKYNCRYLNHRIGLWSEWPDSIVHL